MNNEQQHPEQRYGSKPVPDPTALTTQQLYREIGQLKEEMETKNQSLKEVVFIRFDSVAQQFKASDVAIAAALEAADKSVSKSETSTLKLIEQQASTVRGLAKTVDDQIADIKGRLIRIEEGRITSQASYANIVAMISLIGAIVIGGSGLFIGLTRDGKPQPPVIVERVVTTQGTSSVPATGSGNTQ